MEYSTLKGKLLMPEYGRNVQSMVEYALTIQDKEERTRCVKAIMQTMTNLFPYLRDEESKHKIYDHLAVMSGYRLDIDSEYQPVDADEMHYHPNAIPYVSVKPPRFRHYGKIVEYMIAEAVNIDNEEQRKQLIINIGNRMKSNYAQWNKEQVTDEKIKLDIQMLSAGKLSCNFPEFVLQETQSQPKNQKKKRH